MFDKTIKITVPGGKKLVLTNQEVIDLIITTETTVQRTEVIMDVLRASEALEERLNQANAKLTQYGHMSGF